MRARYVLGQRAYSIVVFPSIIDLCAKVLIKRLGKTRRTRKNRRTRKKFSTLSTLSPHSPSLGRLALGETGFSRCGSKFRTRPLETSPSSDRLSYLPLNLFMQEVYLGSEAVRPRTRSDYRQFSCGIFTSVILL